MIKNFEVLTMEGAADILPTDRFITEIVTDDSLYELYLNTDLGFLRALYAGEAPADN